MSFLEASEMIKNSYGSLLDGLEKIQKMIEEDDYLYEEKEAYDIVTKEMRKLFV